MVTDIQIPVFSQNGDDKGTGVVGAALGTVLRRSLSDILNGGLEVATWPAPDS